MSERQRTAEPTGSFLVRCWVEPREVVGEKGVVRVYLRNLKTGEEHYLNGPSQVAELLMRDLQERQPASAGRQPEDSSAAG